MEDLVVEGVGEGWRFVLNVLLQYSKSGVIKSERSQGRIYVGPVGLNNYRGGGRGGCWAGGSCKLREIAEIT